MLDFHAIIRDVEEEMPKRNLKGTRIHDIIIGETVITHDDWEKRPMETISILADALALQTEISLLSLDEQHRDDTMKELIDELNSKHPGSYPHK